MSVMINEYPGKCDCGQWVPAGQGKVDRPANRGGAWPVTCYVCMEPADQADYRRQQETRVKMERAAAARPAAQPRRPTEKAWQSCRSRQCKDQQKCCFVPCASTEVRGEKAYG